MVQHVDHHIKEIDAQIVLGIIWRNRSPIYKLLTPFVFVFELVVVTADVFKLCERLRNRMRRSINANLLV